MISPFRKTKSGNREIEDLQEAVVATLGPIARLELLRGRLIKSVVLDATSIVEVSHGLGRAHVGWIVAGKNADATVWEVSGTTPSKTLVLRASAAVTINLWIF